MSLRKRTTQGAAALWLAAMLSACAPQTAVLAPTAPLATIKTNALEPNTLEPNTVEAAPNAPGLSAPDFAQQRAELQHQREQVQRSYEVQVRVCWQRFAVNACLQDARRQRHLALAPWQQQELALNAQERAWRLHQREQRLQDKTGAARD